MYHVIKNKGKGKSQITMNTFFFRFRKVGKKVRRGKRKRHFEQTWQCYCVCISQFEEKEWSEYFSCFRQSILLLYYFLLLLFCSFVARSIHLTGDGAYTAHTHTRPNQHIKAHIFAVKLFLLWSFCCHFYSLYVL